VALQRDGGDVEHCRAEGPARQDRKTLQRDGGDVEHCRAYTGTTVAVPNFIVKRTFLSPMADEFNVSFLEVKLNLC